MALCVAAAPAVMALQPPVAQPPAERPAIAEASPPADSAAGAARRAATVAIVPGDRVRVKIWREPTLSDDFIVDDRGEVVLPRLGPVRVAGRSIAAVRDTLVTRYAEYLRNPSVDVTVLRRVGVQGEVRAPNLYYVDVTKTVRDVLTEAGGVTESGNRNHVVLVRDGRTIPLGHWQTGGPVGADLRSGDQIVVGRRSWWSLNALGVVSALGVVVPVGLSLLTFLRK